MIDPSHNADSSPHIAVVSSAGEEKIRPYLDALEQVGAHPFLLSVGQKIPVESLSGILFTGGGDFGSHAYDHPLSSQEENTLKDLEPDRENYEHELIDWADQKDVPVMGICRGFQILNLHDGGTIIADIPIYQARELIPSPIQHFRNDLKTTEVHALNLQTSSRLHECLQPSEIVHVNSIHHQAVHRPGKGWNVSATAPDGIIEAMEKPSKTFWMGVQFHPELLWKNNPVFQNLFAAFTEAARQRGR